ncbi:DUF6919 domain-containing protein [Arthrobacter sp. TMN-37]
MTNQNLSEAPRSDDGEHAQAWRECINLDDACELTARWLEGKSFYMPGYSAAQPATETNQMRDALARLNRLGFLTEDSQPGVGLGTGQGQRAYVVGFCEAGLAELVMRELLETELVCVAHPPGDADYSRICVSIDGGTEFTWLGSFASAAEVLETYTQEANGSLAQLVSECWQLQVFDPHWGRNSRLLPALEDALKAATGV